MLARLEPEQAEITRGWKRFRDWIDWLSGQGVSVNFGSFVGGATLREYAKGWDTGEPTGDEPATLVPDPSIRKATEA